MAFTVADINVDVRFYLGNLTVSSVSDPDLNKIIQTQVDKFSLEDSDRCSVYYYSTVETLRWLIRKQAQGSSGSAGSGAVSKRVEKVGERRIEETYDVSLTNSTATGWDKLLDDLLGNPSMIGCTLPTNPNTKTTGNIIIGGSDENVYENTFASRDRFNKVIKDRKNKGTRWR